MASEKANHLIGFGSSPIATSKSNTSKEVQSSITPTYEATLPYFERNDWHSSLSKEDPTQLKMSYNIPASFSFELPLHGVIDREGYASNVAIIESFLPNGLQLPFIHPVRDVLHFFQIAPAQLHTTAWQMSYCVVWHLVLMETRKCHPDLTAWEFLATHFIHRFSNNICSFRSRPIGL